MSEIRSLRAPAVAPEPQAATIAAACEGISEWNIKSFIKRNCRLFCRIEPAPCSSMQRGTKCQRVRMRAIFLHELRSISQKRP